MLCALAAGQSVSARAGSCGRARVCDATLSKGDAVYQARAGVGLRRYPRTMLTQLEDGVGSRRRGAVCIAVVIMWPK